MAQFPRVGDDFGAYRIDRQLGRGGMGVVFAAEQVGLGRTVALKVLSPELAEQDDYRARFAREATVLARVDSPHIISIFDHGEHDGCLYIATQYVAGGDLNAALNAHGPVPSAQAAEVAAQLAYALSDAHQAGVVHRDLKPSNVLLRTISSEVFAYLCDFGIAQDRSPGLTAPGAVAGTFAYLAPERARGEAATPAADLYALGCVLWTALTGRTPYAGTDIEIGMSHLNAPVPQLQETSGVAAAVNSLLRTAMAKDPAERYRTAEDMRLALQAVARLADATPHPPLAAPPLDRTALRPVRDTPPPSQPSHPSYPSHPSGTAQLPGAPTRPPPPPAPPAVSWSAAANGGSYGASGPGGGSTAGTAGRPRKSRTPLVVVSSIVAVAVIAGGVTAVATSGREPGPVADPVPSLSLTPTSPSTATSSPSPTTSTSPSPEPNPKPNPKPSPEPTKEPTPKPYYPKVASSTGVQISLGPASLRAPAGWGTIDQGIVDGGVGARDYDDFEGYYSSVFVRRTEPAFPLDSITLLDVVAKNAAESIAESEGDLVLIKNERLRPAWLDGVQAARTRAAYRSNTDNLELAEETWFLMKGKFLYRVTFQFSRIDSLSERQALIDSMVVSFRFS